MNSQDATSLLTVSQSSGTGQSPQALMLRNLPWRRLTVWSLRAQKRMGRFIQSCLGVRGNLGSQVGTGAQRPAIKSRTLFSLASKRELEEAVLEPSLETQQKPTGKHRACPWSPQPEPAELKCTKGPSRSSFCLCLKGCGSRLLHLFHHPDLFLGKRNGKLLSSFPCFLPLLWIQPFRTLSFLH